MELLLYVLVAITFSTVLYALTNTISGRSSYQDRLKSLAGGHMEEPRSKQLSFGKLLLVLLPKISRLFASRSFLNRTQAQLIRSGIPLRAEEYVAMCIGIIIVLPILLKVLTGNLWLAIIAAIFGAFFPGLYVNHHKEARLQALNQQLGDALIIMANALRAGFGFQQAMDTVRRELPPPIAVEFAWTLREMSLGFSTEAALMNLSERVQSEDLDMVITGIIIQRQVGGNLAQILENIAGTIRERARIKKEVKVLTAQGKLSGILIGLLPLLLIAAMLVLNPGYLNNMLHDPRGLTILGVAGVMEVFGFIIIRRITNIDF